MRARTLVGIALAVAACGCDPTVWDDVSADAPVFVIRAPAGSLNGAFGTVLAGYDVTLGSVRSSRLAIAGGVIVAPGSPYRVYPAMEGIDSADPLLRLGGAPLLVGCDEPNECSEGYGTSLAAFPEWVAADGTVFHGCIAAPSTSTGNVQIRCEDLQPLFQTIAGPGGEELGASAAGIGFPLHAVGAALFGAPGASSGDGAIYRLPIRGGAPLRLDLSAAAAPSGGRIGTSVAVVALSERTVRFATRATYSTGDRVIVGTIDVDDATGTAIEIHGCIEGPSGFGAALALGDLDSDDVPDLAIGTSSEATEQGIRVYDGASLGALTACGDPMQPVPAATLACAAVADDDVTCGDSGLIGLGASLAIGDVDGDGTQDLIAGAPEASPGGETNAGAVFVLAGEAGMLGRIGARKATLFHSAQAAGDFLGRAVAAIPADDRHEVAAGAPGRREVAVFLCSGLAGDQPTEDGERGCVP